MRKYHPAILFVVLAMAFGLTASANGQEFLVGTPFADNMVLQREMELPVWGWAEPGQEITVTIAGNTAAAVADENGEWRVTLPPIQAGGPHEMIIKGPNEITLTDVLVGEVWLASGQSNMAMRLRAVDDAEAEIAAANYPVVRVLAIQALRSALPERKPRGARRAWTLCTTENVGNISAVPYFFARELHRELDVPIGIINISASATNIEIWTPREGLEAVPELVRWHNIAQRADNLYIQAVDQYKEDLEAWETARKAAEEAGDKFDKPKPEEPVHPFLVERRNDRAPMRNLGALYNGSVYQCASYAIRGMIWYQGESNRDDTSRHYYNFKRGLVHSWREAWGQGDFPVYFVQIGALIAPWRPFWHIPEVWEGQTWSLDIPNTGMAVIHDLCGDLTDIHPTNKQDVAKRLSLWALAKDYGFEDLAYAGPIYRSHLIEGDRVAIKFDYAFDGLKSRDGEPLNWFTIAGADREFHEARAEIQGDSVIVWSDDVPNPVAVRFAWDGSAQPNLVNGADLPAGPFRVGPTYWPY